MTDQSDIPDIPDTPDPSDTPDEASAAPNPLDAYDQQANLIIGAAVTASAAIGWVPAFIDIGFLVASNGAMLSALAVLYKHKWTGEHVRSFVARLAEDSGLAIISVKGLAALLALTGIGMGAGAAINGAMNGALTLAFGKAAQHYFKNQGNVPDDELIKFFRDSLDLSKVFKPPR